jgi:hypothetical protein
MGEKVMRKVIEKTIDKPITLFFIRLKSTRAKISNTRNIITKN